MGNYELSCSYSTGACYISHVLLRKVHTGMHAISKFRLCALSSIVVQFCQLVNDDYSLCGCGTVLNFII